MEAETPPALGSAIASLARTSLDPSASILSARGAAYEEIVESEQLCFICFDQVPHAVLLECGHAGICTSCALQLLERRPGQANCAICRSPISNVVRLRADMSLPSSLFARPRPSSSSSRSQSALLLEAGGASSEREVWPAAAKRAAVVVEVVRRQTGTRWWLPSLLR